MDVSRAMETIVKHNEMVRRAGRGMTARLAGMEASHRDNGGDRLVALARSLCEVLPPHLRPWRSAVCIICDALDERTGFLAPSSAELAGTVREVFGQPIESAELEQCRQWLMRRPKLPGVASRHVHEYRKILLDILAETGGRAIPDRRLAQFLAAPGSVSRIDDLRRLAGRMADRPPRRMVVGVATVVGAGIGKRKSEAATLARLYNLLPATPLGW